MQPWLEQQIDRRCVVQVDVGSVEPALLPTVVQQRSVRARGDADSIEGTLSTVTAYELVLVNAVYLESAGEGRIPMAGTTWIPRPKVRLVQFVEPAIEPAIQ